MVTGLHKQLVALALQLHSLHTNMDQHLQPVIAQQADGVAGLGDLFHDAVCRRYHLAAAWLNGAALAQNLAGKYRILDPGQCPDAAGDRRIKQLPTVRRRGICRLAFRWQKLCLFLKMRQQPLPDAVCESSRIFHSGFLPSAVKLP